MDIYLPADFHELRDTGIIDWRDARATRTDTECSRIAEDSLTKSDVNSVNTCADPLWRVF